MGKKSDYWTHPQNRRAACLAMAIRHADAACYNYDAEDVIAHAAMFGDYIMTGEAPSMDDDTDMGDGASEPVVGLNAGLGTLDNEPLLDMKVTQAATKPTESVQDKATADLAYDIESEKREIEQKLAAAQQLGLRLENVKVIDGEPICHWHFKGRDSLFLRLIVKTAAEDISSKIDKVFNAGFIIHAVHYDDAGFPCVSWSPVSAAA
ncbi:hypothetical protein [Komagataeibacter sp. SM21]|uniref:hypothetical protein n=1 Tax=Komagataeibacter sp. SM21 TaxID=3242899 RepID=UPI003527DCDF